MRHLFCIFCWLIVLSSLAAQDAFNVLDTVTGPGYEQYLAEPLPGNNANWRELTEGIEYDDTLRERETVEEDTAEDPGMNPAAGKTATNLFQILLILIAVGLLALVVIQLRGSGNPFKANRRIKRAGADISLQEIEENLDSVDLRSPLERAITDGNYRRAVRLLYLQTIQLLDEKRLVRWQRDKTNGEYLRELEAGELRARFGEVTLVFERLWYGDRDLNQTQFTEVHREFLGLLDRIRQQSTTAKTTVL